MARDDGASDNKATTASDRRAGAGRRIHFEALVAVGGEAHGPGFEAESVDVSREGMRLRTAYLPQVGERLLCRFDGEAGEIRLEGEVTWCKEEARGGEFGLCFVSVDRQTADAVRALCTAEEDEGADPNKPECSSRGARVKLHIEGLGSPMKARVRDADRLEARVGSNLEFLRVGRMLEYEDVDRASKQEAYVDHVSVDIDAESGIPQLVVALRFDGVLGTVSPRPATPVRSKAAPKQEQPVAPIAAAVPEPEPEPEIQPREPTPVTAIPGVEVRSVDAADDSTDGESEEKPACGPATQKAASGDFEESEQDAPAEKEASESEDDEEPLKASGDANEASSMAAATDADELSDEEVALATGRAAGFRGAGAKAAELTSQAMNRLGPAMSTFGTRARGAMGTMMTILNKKREAHAEAKRAARPRRTTAPPPSGALHSDGRRLIRRDEDEALPPPAKKSAKKAAAIGSAVGLMAVLAIFGMTRGFGSNETAEGAGAELAATALPAQATEAPQLPPGQGQAMNVDVPLFGATPMSTTEQVLPTDAPPAPKAAIDEKPEVGEEDAPSAGPSLEQSWGRGTVKQPVVLQIKFDGPIEGITGADGGSGFTVNVPQRKALSSVSQLARKDKRISSVKVVNRGEGAEVTVRFKGDVPPFLVKGKGDRLEIAISGDKKKIASKGSKSSKRKKGKKK